MRDAHGDVEPFIDQIDDPIEEQHSRDHARVTCQKIKHDRRDVHPAEHHRGGHRELSSRLGVRPRSRSLGLLDLTEDSLAVSQESVAGLGQSNDARRAVQEARADPLFECGNRTRHRGR